MSFISIFPSHTQRTACKQVLMLYHCFSPSGDPAWCCAAFCSGPLCNQTPSTRCQPSTCGASLVVPSGSSPSWPENLAAGVCTSPPTPAGGAVRPGRWAAGRELLYCTHRGEEFKRDYTERWRKQSWQLRTKESSLLFVSASFGEREKKKTMD